LFDEHFYLQLVNEEFSDSLTDKLMLGTLTCHASRIVEKIGDFLSKNPLKDGIKYNHYRPARYFAEKGSTFSISESTLNRFEAMFKAVNALIK